MSRSAALRPGHDHRLLLVAADDLLRAALAGDREQLLEQRAVVERRGGLHVAVVRRHERRARVAVALHQRRDHLRGHERHVGEHDHDRVRVRRRPAGLPSAPTCRLPPRDRGSRRACRAARRARRARAAPRGRGRRRPGRRRRRRRRARPAGPASPRPGRGAACSGPSASRSRRRAPRRPRARVQAWTAGSPASIPAR